MRLGNYHVKFQHNMELGHTYVQIIGDDHPLPKAESFAVKHPNDTFNKKIGRKTALKRALEKTETFDTGREHFTGKEWIPVMGTRPLFTKEERAAIWKDYREKFEAPEPVYHVCTGAVNELLEAKDAEIAHLKSQLLLLTLKHIALLTNKFKA